MPETHTAIRGGQAACQLASATDSQYRQVVERSIEEYLQGEAEPEPLRARALHRDPTPTEARGPEASPALTDRLGMLAAFSARRG